MKLFSKVSAALLLSFGASAVGADIKLNNCPFANCVGEISNRGETYWESVTCDGINASLIMNHRSVSVPTLFMDAYEIQLAPGPSYDGPVCLSYRGKKYVAFVEGMGNAYEIYRIVNTNTFEIQEISAPLALELGFYN